MRYAFTQSEGNIFRNVERALQVGGKYTVCLICHSVMPNEFFFFKCCMPSNSDQNVFFKIFVMTLFVIYIWGCEALITSDLVGVWEF
jgi:hypothetical protein